VQIKGERGKHEMGGEGDLLLNNVLLFLSGWYENKKMC